MSTTPEKAKLYKTAKATIACAHFPKGAVVSVQYDWTDEIGDNWYLIKRTEKGDLPYDVAYPEHHLTEFCL